MTERFDEFMKNLKLKEQGTWVEEDRICGKCSIKKSLNEFRKIKNNYEGKTDDAKPYYHLRTCKMCMKVKPKVDPDIYKVPSGTFVTVRVSRGSYQARQAGKYIAGGTSLDILYNKLARWK